MTDASDLFGEDDAAEFKADESHKVHKLDDKPGDLFEKIESESSVLGNLISKIPGFDGYIERSRRREADEMLRSHIGRHLEGLRLRLANIQESLAFDIVKAIEYAEALGRIDVALRALASKVKDAPTGYSGFFDAVKIREEELANIYAFDENMLEYVDQLEEALLALEKAVHSEGDIAGAMREMLRISHEANETYDGRQDLVAGIVD